MEGRNKMRKKMKQYEEEHLNIVRSMAPECTVLLKKDGTFPMKEAGKIALYGNGVRKTIHGYYKELAGKL